MHTLNQSIACKPFEVTSNRTETSKGFAQLQQKIRLVKTEVVYDYVDIANNIKIDKGSFIYVRGENTRLAWAKEIYLNEKDEEFILVHTNQIVCIEEV